MEKGTKELESLGFVKHPHKQYKGWWVSPLISDDIAEALVNVFVQQRGREAKVEGKDGSGSSIVWVYMFRKGS